MKIRRTLPTLIDALEPRRFFNATATDLIGPMNQGDGWDYSVTGYGLQGYNVPTGPGGGVHGVSIGISTSFNGHAVVERDNILGHVNIVSGFPIETDDLKFHQYDALTDAGFVEYGDAWNYGVVDTYDAPLVVLPAVLVKGQTYDSVVGNKIRTTDSSGGVTTTTGSREVQTTLIAEPSDGTIADTINGGYQAYEVRQTITNTVGNAQSASKTYLIYFAKDAGMVLVTDSTGNVLDKLTSTSGAVPRGTAYDNTTLMQPRTNLFAYSTLPSVAPDADSSAEAYLTNNTKGHSTDTVTVTLYLSKTGKVDNTSIAIGSIVQDVTDLYPNASANVVVPLSYANLPGGTYKLFVKASDATGAVNTADSGQTVTVTSSALSASVVNTKSVTAKPGQSIGAKILFQNSSTDIIPSVKYTIALVPTNDSATVVLKTATLHQKFKPNGKPIKIKLQGKLAKAIPAGTYTLQITYITPDGKSDSLESSSTVTVKQRMGK